MIRRLLNGLAALLLLGLGLVGLPAFLLGAYRALDAQMPDLVDLPSVLLSPGDGGLFLLLLFAIGMVMGGGHDEEERPKARSPSTSPSTRSRCR